MSDPPTPNSASLCYETLTDLGAAQRIVPAWNELLDRSRCNLAFSSPTWYFAACQTEPELTPWLALAWRGESLAGVFPIAVAQETQEAIFPNSMSDYHDLVVAEDDMAPATGLLEWALQERALFRRLELRKIRHDSNLATAVALLDVRQKPTIQRMLDQEASYIELAATRADYLASRSRVFRKGAARILRKAEADGIAMRELTPANFPPEKLAALFLSLHFSRFGDRSVFDREVRHREFVERALPVLFAERRLHVFVLQKEEQTVALDLNFRGVRSLCLWNGGYLPEAAGWSPGKLLLLFGIQRAHELGLEEYDLLRGRQDWKASWANRNRRLEKMVIEA
jgi:CelD/BcsL family acetyltransferase involved in cellulose biosynthesis